MQKPPDETGGFSQKKGFELARALFPEFPFPAFAGARIQLAGPGHSFQALGVDFLAAGDALPEFAFAQASAPRVLANTRLTFTPMEATQLQLEWLRVGSYWLDAGDTTKYGGHSLINLRGSWALSKLVSLFGSVYNIADRRYADSASITSSTPVFSPGLPRTSSEALNSNGDARDCNDSSRLRLRTIASMVMPMSLVQAQESMPGHAGHAEWGCGDGGARRPRRRDGRARSELGSSAAFDAHGALWSVAKQGEHVIIRRSTDLGRTWSAPRFVNASAEPVGADGDARPKLAFGTGSEVSHLDTTAATKPYTGMIRFARSIDGGKTFTAPVTVHADRQEITHRFDALAVNSKGRYSSRLGRQARRRNREGEARSLRRRSRLLHGVRRQGRELQGRLQARRPHL